MNYILRDLKTAIRNISSFYYEVPDIAIKDESVQPKSDQMKNYERRFVVQLLSEYNKLIGSDCIGMYKDVKTDFEVPKSYIFRHPQDASIQKTFRQLYNENSEKTFEEITTIPDFFIHKSQDNSDTENQKLIVEVKTSRVLSQIDFFLDFFKLNIYAEFYNFQNAVSLILNNEEKKINELVKNYIRKQYYISPKGGKNIYFFIKKNYDAKIRCLPLNDFKL